MRIVKFVNGDRPCPGRKRSIEKGILPSDFEPAFADSSVILEITEEELDALQGCLIEEGFNNKRTKKGKWLIYFGRALDEVSLRVGFPYRQPEYVGWCWNGEQIGEIV